LTAQYLRKNSEPFQ